MFWVIPVSLLFLWRADTFLLNPGTTPSDGFTESHFITVMNLLLEEKQQRQHLEFALNKIYQDLLASNANTTDEVRNMQFSKQNFEQRIGNNTDSLSRSYKELLTNFVNLKEDNKQLRLQLFKINNETEDLRKKDHEIQKNFISLNEESKRLNQELNQSRDIMVHLKEEVKSLTHLKSINQLQDVKDLQKAASATGNHLHIIDAQLNKITVTQQARDQDFLALYNQTVSIQTALTQRIQKGMFII